MAIILNPMGLEGSYFNAIFNLQMKRKDNENAFQSEVSIVNFVWF